MPKHLPSVAGGIVKRHIHARLHQPDTSGGACVDDASNREVFAEEASRTSRLLGTLDDCQNCKPPHCQRNQLNISPQHVRRRLDTGAKPSPKPFLGLADVRGSASAQAQQTSSCSCLVAPGTDLLQILQPSQAQQLSKHH